MVIDERSNTATAVPSALAAYIETERRRADVAGAAVALFDAEGMRFEGGFGLADIRRGEPVTPDTRFRAASISKLFTTTLVFQEIAAGRMSLDDWANRHLDAPAQVRDRAGQPVDITLRHLLTHTSGLPVSWRGLIQGNAVMRRFMHNSLRVPATFEDVVLGQRVVRPAGGPIVYANGAFELLGYMVARAHGRRFEDIVRERVLEPLGMHSSAFAAELDPQPGVATPYGTSFGGAGRKPTARMRNLAGPAGALATSARDLARFGRMALRRGELDGVRVADGALLEDAMRLHVRNHPDLDRGWGLGFEASTFREERMPGHGGGLPGVSTYIALLPSRGIGAVVLTNGGDASFVHRIVTRTLEAALGLDPEATPGNPRGTGANDGAWSEFTSRVTGRYALLGFAPPGLISLVQGSMMRPRVTHISDGVLVIEGADREPVLLYPDGAVGRYRAVHPMFNGCRAVIEETPEGTLAYAGFVRLRRK